MKATSANGSRTVFSEGAREQKPGAEHQGEQWLRRHLWALNHSARFLPWIAICDNMQFASQE